MRKDCQSPCDDHSRHDRRHVINFITALSANSSSDCNLASTVSSPTIAWGIIDKMEVSSKRKLMLATFCLVHQICIEKVEVKDNY